MAEGDPIPDILSGPILSARMAAELGALGDAARATTEAFGDLRESYLNPSLRWPALRVTPQFVWYWKRKGLHPSRDDLSKLHALRWADTVEDDEGIWRLYCGLSISPDRTRGFAEHDRLDGVVISLEVCRVCAAILDGMNDDEMQQAYLHKWG
jgi:hypothetical protein